MILVEGLCSLLRSKRFYRRNTVNRELERDGFGSERRNRATTSGDDSVPPEGEESSSADEEHGAEDDGALAMEMEMLGGPELGDRSPRSLPETPARAFAMKTLAGMRFFRFSCAFGQILG